MLHDALDTDQAAELAETFHLLGDPNRLRLVLACLDQAVSVQSLADGLGLSPSLTSHHLRLLKAARLMRAERRGRHVFYRAADEHVRRMLADMVEHVQEEGA
jgi:DNA-binding transcriptional ArsR family regulator